MKYAVLLLSLFIFSLPVCAIEEINLEIPEEQTEPIKAKTDYLADVYYGSEKNASPVFKLFSEKGLETESGIIDSVKLHFFGSQVLTDKVFDGNNSFLHSIEAAEPGIRLKFNDEKTEFAFDYNITRFIEAYHNDFTEKISLLYLSQEINPNQKIYIGQGTRLPSSVDSGLGLYGIETVQRSQLARNTGNVRSLGIRNIADYKYAKYDIGFYDSARYFNDLGSGTDFTGHLIIKPFGINDESKTNIQLGAGYNIGRNGISYDMYSFYAAYDYKKFHIHTEYLNADGSNGIIKSDKKSEGFYAHTEYDITPKLSVLARFDTFIKDTSHSNSYSVEYTAGITYKLFKNMKFMLNYVKKINSDGKNSDMILFATRFFL